MSRTGNIKVILALAILSITTVAAVGHPWAVVSPEELRSGPLSSWLNEAQLDDFDAFELYWLGSSFDDLQLYGIHREVGPDIAGEPPGHNSVDFIYGDCDASAGGCPFPLVVQIWPACRRNLSMYEVAPGVPMPYQELRVRGVPAAMFDSGDGGRRLELYTGAVTVVLFGDSVERLHKAAEHLRGVGPLASANGEVAAGTPLTPPLHGAMAGALVCEH